MANIFFILDLFSAIFIFFLGYYVFLRDYKRNVNRIFFLFSLTAILWAVSSAAFRALRIPVGKGAVEFYLEKGSAGWIWNQIGWIGIAFLPSTFLNLSVIVTDQRGIFKGKKFLTLIYLLSLFFLIWAFLGRPETYSIFYSLFTLYFISCLLLSFFLLVKNYFSLKSSREKEKLRYFLIGFLIPGIGGTALDVVFPFLKYKQFVGTTFSLYLFSLGYFFVAIGVLSYGLFIDYREVLEKIFKGLTEMVIVIDRQGIILMTNQGTLTKLKYKEEEFIGKRIENFIEKGKQKLEEISKELKNLGDVFQGTINLLTREKETIPFLTTASLVKEGIIFVGQDIKELLAYQEKLEKEVREKTRELEEAKTVLEIKVRARTRELEELAQSLEEQVKARTKELQEKVAELEKFQKIAVGREIKMIELKKEVERLKKELEKWE